MQKRIFMVLIVLLALTAGAFALDQNEAAARAHSFAFTANVSTTTVILPDQDASLFAGIEGTELSGDEMMMVEGEGPTPNLIDNLWYSPYGELNYATRGRNLNMKKKIIVLFDWEINTGFGVTFDSDHVSVSTPIFTITITDVEYDATK